MGPRLPPPRPAGGTLSRFEEPTRWTAPDGARLALYRESAGAGPRAALLLVHGWGEYAARYGEFARWLASRGISVYAADLRGHGHSPGARGHIERFAQYLSDVAALRRLIAHECAAPQLLLGISFGGFIVLRYLETAPQGVAGAVAVTPYLALTRRAAAWKLGLARLFGDVLPRLPLPTGLQWPLTTREREAWTAMQHDPLAHQRITPRAWQEVLAAQQALRDEKHRIAAPLLVLLAGEDHIVSSAAAAEFASQLRAQVTVRSYPGLYHSLLLEPERESVFSDIGIWADQLLGGET